MAGVHRGVVAGDWWLLQARVLCYHGEMPGLFTIGYEGCTIAEVLAALKRARIKLLIDVRALPRSRKPGFSKRQLAAALDEHGIRYVHLQALGTPKPGRDAVRAGHPELMEVIFRAHMEGDRSQAELADAAGLTRRERCCLLCFEGDPMQCHPSHRRGDDRGRDGPTRHAPARGWVGKRCVLCPSAVRLHEHSPQTR